MYKNIEKQSKLKLKDQVEYQKGQVVSKTLVQNDKGGGADENAAGGIILKESKIWVRPLSCFI